MRVAITFPGQGTQSPGMGRPWRDHVAWRVVTDAEAALGEPLAPLLLDADADALGRTRNAQLSVLLTSLVAWEAHGEAIAKHHDVVAFAGHSLGQVTALIASGVLSVGDGVRFAARRAELTQRAADSHPGKMAALLGASPETAVAACAGVGDAWVANDNAPGQVVIAGTPQGVDAAIEAAKAHGVKRALPLPVGGAFHTPLMRDARAGLVAALSDIEFAAPSAPIVSNADACAHDDSTAWRERLADHPLLPVRWRESMLVLSSAPLGAAAFFEIGHGAMVAGVARRTVPDVRVIAIDEPESDTRITSM